MEKIAGSGSYRQYFRIHGISGSVIAAYNADVRENIAFLKFSDHFRMMDLPVPQILISGSDTDAYLLEDLGDTSLFSSLSRFHPEERNYSPDIVKLYLKTVELLPKFQVTAGDSIPFDYCYPRAAFDRQSMIWDLNYFKYYFLKLARITFDEQLLEDDFIALSGFLLQVPQDHFMYRDFQSRNIMIYNNSPWFIDYQGGRRGGLQYDLASLLYDAKADLSEAFRMQLFEYYIEKARRSFPFDEVSFRKYFDGFVLIRILQAMGAYGFRGYYENKPHFLQSIPYAVRNLSILRERGGIPLKLTMLMRIIDGIIDNPEFHDSHKPVSNLNVRIFSFSYKQELPADDSGHGGGFIFDCRSLPNPGRYPEYEKFTGLDEPVIEYLKKEPEVDAFLNHVFALVGQSVKIYTSRGFTSLLVGFGCTGGRHRSVYCANELARFLREKYTVKVDVKHTNTALS